MHEQEQEPQETPPQVTCSGGIKLPSLALLFGQRFPVPQQEAGEDGE